MLLSQLFEIADATRQPLETVNMQSTIVVRNGVVTPMKKPALINLTGQDIHIRYPDGPLKVQIPAVASSHFGQPVERQVGGQGELLVGTAVVDEVNVLYTGQLWGLPEAPEQDVTYIVTPLAALAVGFGAGVRILFAGEVIGFGNLARLVS